MQRSATELINIFGWCIFNLMETHEQSHKRHYFYFTSVVSVFTQKYQTIRQELLKFKLYI